MCEFDKIIGYEPEKKELKRICDVLVNKEKYDKFGAKISQGLLIYGEPGVGKSLMAECLIEKTKRKCYTVRKNKSDKDFIDEITSNFEKAKNDAPSIVYLDDMDKFANEDERHIDSEEYVTIQSCIDEIKGYDVFVIATANNIRKLPQSLLRTGRFSKRLEIRNPVGEDAEKIMSYYLKNKKNVSNINMKEGARLLSGRSCAVLESVVNEAGIYAGFENKDKIEHCDMIRACMRILYDAPEIENLLFSKSNESNRITAYHEAGHVVVSEILEPESITLASIAKYNGSVAGITSNYQDENYFTSIDYMKNRVKVLLAGKAAIEIVYGTIDVGANSDLHRVYNIVTRFVDDYCGYGFDSFLTDMRCEETKNKISQKVALEIEKYYQEAKNILCKNKNFLEKIVDAFMEKTTLMMADIKEIKKQCNII